MQIKIFLLISLLAAIRCEDDDKSDEDDDVEVDSKMQSSRVCVPNYLCDDDGYVKTDGEDLLDPRKQSAPTTDDSSEESVDPKKRGCRPPNQWCRLRGSTRPPPPPRTRCGVRGSGSGVDTRILAEGQDGDTEPGEFPWQGALLEEVNGKTVFRCACVLINKWFALTAAHCVPSCRENPTKYFLRFGVWDTRKSSQQQPTQDARLSNCTIHPDFDDENLKNDIAVLGMKPPGITYTSNIQPVCLPRSNQTNDGQKCIVTGWGKDSWQGGSFSSVLRMVVVPVIRNSECQEMLRKTRLAEFFELDRCFVCAGGRKGQDACKGDGGGPLVCSNKDGIYGLTGIVSWGIGCGVEGHPGVYVRVGCYLNFISRATRLPLEVFWPPRTD